MSYYLAETLDTPFRQAVERTAAKFKDHGFGLLTKIDVQATLKEKIAADFRPYVILGACNPRTAHQALQAEDGASYSRWAGEPKSRPSTRLLPCRRLKTTG